MPPFSSISHAFSTSHPHRLSFPSYSGLTLSLSAIFSFFLRDEFNSCRRSADALSIFPDFCRHRVAFAYRFRCADTPESIRSPPFNITHPPASFLPAAGCVPACDSSRGWRTRCRINLFHPTVRAAAGSRELSSEHEDNDDRQDGSKIDRFFLLWAFSYNNEIITLSKILDINKY